MLEAVVSVSEEVPFAEFVTRLCLAEQLLSPDNPQAGTLYGCRAVPRSTRPAEPTAAGDALLPHAHQVPAHLQHIPVKAVRMLQARVTPAAPFGIHLRSKPPLAAATGPDGALKGAKTIEAVRQGWLLPRDLIGAQMG